MNKNIAKLKTIASKKSRLIIGLMSGTSLDGLDVVLVKISGSGLSTKFRILEFETVPYTSQIKEKIWEVFAKQTIDFHALCELNPFIGLHHGSIILRCLKKWKYTPKQIDVIASHGQTIFHAPKFLKPGSELNSTLQIGDGDHVAVKTGIITLSDFRQKHIAAGGEGAPLAVYGDYLLFSKKNEDRIMLNAGGIGNFTYLPGTRNPSDVFVTDTGTANTLIDQAVRFYLKDVYFDKDSAIALKGTYNKNLLSALKSDPFFKQPFPKTIGPELFNMGYVKKAQQISETTSISVEDLVATLTRFSAETMSEAILRVIKNKKSFTVYLSGGGAHNPLLMRWLKELLHNVKFKEMSELGVHGDAKEALLFAILANEALAGGKVNFGSRSKVPSVSMGKISFPN